MPVTVRKNPKQGYDIIEKSTGKKKGHSKIKKDAEISASIRNRAIKRKRGTKNVSR